VPDGRAGDIVTGVLDRLEELDSRIESVAQHWTVSRMPVIDRNVLRIALHELENDPAVPTAVIVSEAVRLASTYSTERSAAFVNGVLSSLARTVRGWAPGAAIVAPEPLRTVQRGREGERWGQPPPGRRPGCSTPTTASASSGESPTRSSSVTAALTTSSSSASGPVAPISPASSSREGKGWARRVAQYD